MRSVTSSLQRYSCPLASHDGTQGEERYSSILSLLGHYVKFRPLLVCSLERTLVPVEAKVGPKADLESLKKEKSLVPPALKPETFQPEAQSL